jgi:hypothetical protein
MPCSPSRWTATLLVKLLDAAEPLSVQIHPSDDYVGLRPGECGKPEAWYVVERDPGAGLFLGFREGVGAAEVRAALDANADVSRLMHFVPVEPGDFFVIEAGTPHAIGAGVTLVEPQRMIAGSSGVTYRYWDWGRRYDSAGVPSVRREGARAPRGPRHRRDRLGARHSARSFVDTIRRRAGVPVLTAQRPSPSRLSTRLAQPHARPGGSPPRPTSRWHASRAPAPAPSPPGPSVTMGLTVLEGSVQFANGEVVHRGETAALPEGAAGLPVTLSGAHALLMTARPA